MNNLKAKLAEYCRALYYTLGKWIPEYQEVNIPQTYGVRLWDGGKVSIVSNDKSFMRLENKALVISTGYIDALPPTPPTSDTEGTGVNIAYLRMKIAQTVAREVGKKDKNVFFGLLHAMTWTYDSFRASDNPKVIDRYRVEVPPCIHARRCKMTVCPRCLINGRRVLPGSQTM